MKTIQLTKGKVALVDDDDFDRVSRYKWYAICPGGVWYAARTTFTLLGKKQVYLHRFILNATGSKQVDHINRNGLDCQKSNLRKCTQTDNNRNQRKSKNNSTGYKGVCYNKERHVYQAYITVNYRHYFLGTFNSVEEAARAYDKAATSYFGEYACLNFPTDKLEDVHS